jgi:uncharacterized protein (DUF2126 family)
MKKAIKVSKNIKGTSKSAAKKKAATGTQKQAKAASSKQAAKVVSKIKAAGLGALIGKISKRAAKSAKFVIAQGRSPDSTKGRALGSVGSTTLGKASGKAAFEGARVAGVKTAGKGRRQFRLQRNRWSEFGQCWKRQCWNTQRGD